MDKREILFEFTRIGNNIKVAALDANSLVEVSILGPAGANEAQLKATALRKLEYVLAKKGVITGK